MVKVMLRCGDDIGKMSSFKFGRLKPLWTRIVRIKFGPSCYHANSRIFFAEQNCEA